MKSHKNGIEVVACAEIDADSAKKIGQACCALGKISPEGSIDFTGKPYLIPLFRSGFLRDYVLSSQVNPPSLEAILAVDQVYEESSESHSEFYTQLGVGSFEAADHTDLRLRLTDTRDFRIYRETVLRTLLDIFDQPPISIDNTSHHRFNEPLIQLGRLHPNIFFGEDYFPPEKATLGNAGHQQVADFEDVFYEYYREQLSEVYKSAPNPDEILPGCVSLVGVSLMVQKTSKTRDRKDEVKHTRRFIPTTVKEALTEDRKKATKAEDVIFAPDGEYENV